MTYRAELRVVRTTLDGEEENIINIHEEGSSVTSVLAEVQGRLDFYINGKG